MTENNSHSEIFQEIYDTKSFEKLGPYTENKFWSKLGADDRQLLAELLILHGEQQLALGKETVFNLFAKANEIKPDDPLLYYLQGAIFSNNTRNALSFVHACACFMKATELDPSCFDAWLFWAKVVFQQAEETESEELGLEAERLITKACEFRSGDATQEASLYWSWAMIHSFLGRLHGEAVDLKKALNKFSVAASLGLNDTDFWEQYGHVTCELGSLINNPESLLDGKTYFENAVQVDSDNGSAWLSLALCYQKLYEVYAKQEYFLGGCEIFEKAQSYNPQEVQLWSRWGVLLFQYGRATFDTAKIEGAFEKLRVAHECEPDNPFILGKWAEAELVYGIYNERIDHLRLAEARIIACLKLQDDNSEAWYVYGTCLNEMGRYFSDAGYYVQAIEKFQYGLFLSAKDPMMAQGISLAYYSLGEMKNDPSLIELSILYSEKALEDSKIAAPQLYNDVGVSLMKMAELTSDKSYLEAALEKFEVALEHFSEENPESYDSEWLYNYGCALDFIGDFSEDAKHYEKAILWLTKFLQIDPGYLHAHYNLASAYSHLGELVGDIDCFHKAIEHYQKFLKEDNEDEVVWNDYGLTLLNLADLLHDPSLPDLSNACFAQAEEKFLHAASLGNSSAFYNLACLYSLTGHYAQAIHYMEKAEQQRALPTLEEIMEDEWLEQLLHTPEFRAFLANRSSLDNE